MFGKMTSNDAVSRDLGLFILRLGIGTLMFVVHGYAKIIGGPERWEPIGHHMLGVSAIPVLWGFLSAFAESVGAILLVLGPLFRPMALLLAFNMFVAAMYHLNLPPDSPVSGLSGASHALELMVVFVALFFTGPGRFAFKLGRVK